MTETPAMEPVTEEAERAARLEQSVLDLQSTAWSRIDGGQEFSIAASLVQEAADAIARLTADLAAERAKVEALDVEDAVVWSCDTPATKACRNPFGCHCKTIESLTVERNAARAVGQHWRARAETAERALATASEDERDRLYEMASGRRTAWVKPSWFRNEGAMLPASRAALRASTIPAGGSHD